MRPLAAMGALNRTRSPSAALVKRTSPVSALNACSSLSPCGPTAQMTDSAPLPIVLAIGEPFPLTCPHHAVATPGGDPAVMRSATSPLVPDGHEVPCPGNARMVPDGVATTVGAVITTPRATCGAATPPPTPPRL